MKVLIIDQNGNKMQRIADQLLQEVPNLKKSQVFYFHEVWGNLLRGSLGDKSAPAGDLLTKDGLTADKVCTAVKRFIREFYKDNIMVIFSTRLADDGYGHSVQRASWVSSELYMDILLEMNRQEKEDGQARVFCCTYGCHADTREMGYNLSDLWEGKYADKHDLLPQEICLYTNIAWVRDRDSDQYTKEAPADPDDGVLVYPEGYMKFLKSLK